MSLLKETSLPIRRRMTTDNYRLFFHSSERGAFRDTVACLGSCPGAAALSGRLIGPPNWACQRPCREIVILPKEIDNRWETLIYQGFAPYLSHIPATFLAEKNLNRRGSNDIPAQRVPGTGDHIGHLRRIALPVRPRTFRTHGLDTIPDTSERLRTPSCIKLLESITLGHLGRSIRHRRDLG